ncbi:MAG: hypothetical protein O3A47_05385 [Chloroflexi bacterium]|nr:hypothetical protein [Chloroflexota bacterium]
MSSIAGHGTGPIGAGLRGLLPGSKKTWAIVTLSTAILVLLTAGLAQIFRIDLGSSSQQSEMPSLEWRDMIGVLTRQGEIPMEQGESPSVDVLLATPQYFAALRREPPTVADDKASVYFYVTETAHIDDLPLAPPVLPLSIDGLLYSEPTESNVIADSYHHRSTLVRYAYDESAKLGEGSVIEMTLPGEKVGTDDDVLRWALPLEYSADYSSLDVAVGGPTGALPVPSVSGVAVLAILGGMLAAMWPCLFQLTAYFIPAMAGMSMNEASSASGLKPRVGVVRVAFFFVLGFTIVYTLAGAIVGYGSQQLSNNASFYVWQRYLSIGAGVILIGLALRVAVRVRAPLVCKMPIASRLGGGSKNGITSPLESMLVGISFATGCMTCFGSAVLIGMVLYVGLAGSPLVGATLLFLFSLGMGIPLVFGAMAMARVLPLLFRVEKVLPWMGLASATIIAGYGVLLITGNSMAMSSWFYKLLGISSSV